MEAKPSAIGGIILGFLGKGILASFALMLSSCANVGYVVENGVGQWKLFNRARPIEEVLTSAHTKEDLRIALQLVLEAKKFSVQELGLKATSNYRSFVDVKAPCVTWAVSAASPLKLEDVYWNFPIVGKVPYLGYFKKESAKNKAKEMAESGSDSWVRCVPTFSTLGWFSDPIYSSMLLASKRDIIDVVIHESLHATVWIKNNVDFNEKLANFVGLEGSLLFLKAQLGLAAYDAARRQVAGEKAFGDFMGEQKKIYELEVQTLQEKERFYADLPKKYSIFLETRKNSVTPLSVNFEGWNNAAFLAYSNYYSDFSTLQHMLTSCEGNLKKFVQWVSYVAENKKERLEGAPEEHLASLMKEIGCTVP